jgi:hypothetical protein
LADDERVYTVTVTHLQRKPRTDRLKRYFSARERARLAAMAIHGIGDDGWDEATHRPYVEKVVD